MKIVVRVDASVKIGSGHLMRCLTLANRWRKNENGEVHFISRDLEGNCNYLIEREGFPLHLLPRHEVNETLEGYGEWLTVTQEEDAKETYEILTILGEVDRLLVDSYALDIIWEQQVRKFVREIIVIDDLANRSHDCDVLLDQGFYRDYRIRYDGLVPKSCRLLLGPSHAILRDEFYTAAGSLRNRKKLETILVFYGGSDPTDETSKAIQALARLSLPGVQVTVIVGSMNQRKSDVKDICEAYNFLHYYEQVTNMAEFMNKADLMLCAGGSVTWERCFLALPGIVTAVAENQVKNCEYCSSLGLMEYLGFYKAVTVEILMKKIKDMQCSDLQKLGLRDKAILKY